MTGGNYRISDVFRSPTGTLFVTAYGLDEIGGATVVRSADGGVTWDPTDLGNPEENPSYFSRVFGIDGSTIGVSVGQGGSPWDNWLRYSVDDGVTFSTEWINVSNSGDFVGNKANGVVIQAPSGRYAAFFVFERAHSRLTDALDSWSATTRNDIADAGSRIAVASDGARLLLAQPVGPEVVLNASTDDGETFDELSRVTTPHGFYHLALWHDPVSDGLHMCGSNGSEGVVYHYCSADGGESWNDGSLYLDGVSLASRSSLACFMDETGLYVAYRDLDSDEARVVLPGSL